MHNLQGIGERAVAAVACAFLLQPACQFVG